MSAAGPIHFTPPARPVAGFVLIGAGMALLLASAVAGRAFWAPEPVAFNDIPPHLSLLSQDFALPLAGGFARDGFDEVPLPRPVPVQRARPAAPAAPVETVIAAAPRPAPAPQPGAPARQDPPARAEAPTEARAEPLPEAVTVAFTAPALIPPPRPLRGAAPVTTEAPAPDLALARSPVPPVRPETVTRLALAPAPLPQTALPVAPVLARATPAPPTAQPEATTPQPAAPALAVAPALSGSERCDDPALTRAIPRRPNGAEGGQAAVARLASLSGANRDRAALQAIMAGNIPEHLRRLVPVTLTGTAPDGRPARITLCVMPDYLALGRDSDFVRVPLGMPAARAVADRFAMILPTTAMVDAIHAQARVRLTPAPMTPGPQMESTDYFLRHNATLEGQRRNTGAPLGVLVSGHKKDVVLTNRLQANPGRVAIYGWHQASGRPIQPLSTVHGAQYADYSHGIRLISRTAYLNGRPVDLLDLLGNSRTAAALSHEGPIAARIMLAAAR